MRAETLGDTPRPGSECRVTLVAYLMLVVVLAGLMDRYARMESIRWDGQGQTYGAQLSSDAEPEMYRLHLCGHS